MIINQRRKLRGYMKIMDERTVKTGKNKDVRSHYLKTKIPNKRHQRRKISQKGRVVGKKGHLEESSVASRALSFIFNNPALEGEWGKGLNLTAVAIFSCKGWDKR